MSCSIRKEALIRNCTTVAHLIALVLLALAAAATTPARAADEWPELPAPRTLKMGGKFYDITLHRAGVPMKSM